MTLPAHLAAGYLAIKLVDNINPSLGFGANELLLAGVVGSALPDVDFVFFKHIKDHHNSWFHAPSFWMFICLILILISLFLSNQGFRNISIALSIGLFTHLFLDWFAGRTAGIRVFYPISKKMFSLYPLNPQKGKVTTSLIPKKEHWEFFKFYSQNKFLLSVEILLIVLGLSIWILNIT